MSKPFKVGVSGYGWAATAHIDAIRHTRLGDVCAIYSSRASSISAAELEEKHGVPIRIYGSYEAMLEDPEVNVVDITSYPSKHREQAVLAAKAGKHLIIEKPLAMSLADCRAILDAVESAGVEACVCFECRFSGQFQTTRKLITEGLLGSIHYGEIDYYHGVGPWYGQFRWNVKKENGGSSLLSAGCHALDALLMCMGGEVESVTSYSTGSKSEVFRQYEYPTTAVNLIKFTDGRIGKTASVIDCWQPYYFHTHLVGSEGSLLDNKFYTTKFGALKKDGWSQLNMSMMDSGDVADHPYQVQFDAFFDALEAGRRMELTSLQESYKSFEVIFACDRSAAEGREVKISEMRA
jgi:UDP-N-acetyl-2-amino-2-deoxyglucuronate dehydrogenase